MQIDIYLNNEHVGGISAIGLAEQVWEVGYTFPYPHLGARQVFMVEELIPVGERLRANVVVVKGKGLPQGSSGGP